MIWKKGTLGYKIPGYTFNPDMETVGSMQLLKELVLPKGKAIELLLWSGDCQATEEALAALDAGGYQNLNGGNARVDALYRGICHICPLSILGGKYRQYLAPAGNEYLYTNNWTENYGGYALVIDTYENTREPRYLPVDVYYHLYITGMQAGLNSLKKVYAWCKEQELCWLQATDYTRALTGFFTARTGRLGNNGYYIENYPGLHTVRLDGERREVDILKSKNVLGYNHFGGDLYISLLSGERAEIFLTAKELTPVYLDKATGLIRNATVAQNGVSGEVRRYARGFIEFAGSEDELVFTLDGQEVAAEPGYTKRFPLPAGAGRWSSFQVECRK